MAVTPIYALPYQVLSDPPDGPSLGEDLALAVEAELARIDGDVAAAGANPNGADGVNAAATTVGTNTTTSATYVNMAGTGAVTSFSFTKKYSAAVTQVKVDFHATFYGTGSGAAVSFAVLIGATDYDVTRFALSSIAVRQQSSGVRLISGLAAATYTVQCRWRRTAGAGTLTRDVDDWLSVTATEVGLA
jgi:hypothetical protein